MKNHIQFDVSLNYVCQKASSNNILLSVYKLISVLNVNLQIVYHMIVEYDIKPLLFLCYLRMVVQAELYRASGYNFVLVGT